MKNLLSRMLLISSAIIVISCGGKQEVKEQYCGLEMSGFEVIDYKTMGNKGYDYSDADKALHTELTSQVNKLFDNGQEIVISFAFKDADKIALYIIAPDDKALVEKVSCYLLEANIEGMPKNKNLLFYTNDHDTLIAAVKSK